MGIKIGILLLLVSGSVIEAVPTLTIQPAAPSTGSTLTVTCELAGFTNAAMDFKKDGTIVYTCAFGGITCNENTGISDYSEVNWSDTDKGIITISNADQTRDGGEWTCEAGGVGSGTSVAVTLAITADCGNPTTPTNGQVSVTTTTYQSTATYSCDTDYTIDTTTTTCQSDGTWSAVPTCTGTTVSQSTTTTTPGTTATNTTSGPTKNTTSGPTNHTEGSTTNTISSTTASSNSLPVSVIIAISVGGGLVILVGITIAIVCYCKRKSNINETVDDKHRTGIDNHGIDLNEHGNRDHHL